ncbi:hypothetical protein KL86DPRO_30093 [uncultured delta proteobacterium]|uniref:Uncharacterized protein n=1 Tax=uncultured delta proteobacterium TaxID=34034 RepID=A0A212K7P2_9DELT|nr:hypothetical protein KL86DPRO_30093 [uncultured delta proteobacterium]
MLASCAWCARRALPYCSLGGFSCIRLTENAKTMYVYMHKLEKFFYFYLCIYTYMRTVCKPQDREQGGAGPLPPFGSAWPWQVLF